MCTVKLHGCCNLNVCVTLNLMNLYDYWETWWTRAMQAAETCMSAAALNWISWWKSACKYSNRTLHSLPLDMNQCRLRELSKMLICVEAEFHLLSPSNCPRIVDAVVFHIYTIDCFCTAVDSTILFRTVIQKMISLLNQKLIKLKLENATTN